MGPHHLCSLTFALGSTVFRFTWKFPSLTRERRGRKGEMVEKSHLGRTSGHQGEPGPLPLGLASWGLLGDTPIPRGQFPSPHRTHPFQGDSPLRGPYLFPHPRSPG